MFFFFHSDPHPSQATFGQIELFVAPQGFGATRLGHSFVLVTSFASNITNVANITINTTNTITKNKITTDTKI